MDVNVDHYEVLGVRPYATQREIRDAYLFLAGMYHPDQDGVGTNSASIMKQLNIARQILSDPVRRAEYDRSIGVYHSDQFNGRE